MILEESYVTFIVRNDLTQAQFLLLYLLYKNKPKLIELYKLKYPTMDGTMIGQKETNDLFDKGFLKKNIKGQTVVTKKFLEAFIDKFAASDEILALYPKYHDTGIVNIPLTAMDRQVLANLYESAINGSIEEHYEVLKDIQYAKDNKLIVIGLDKFIKSHWWKVIRPKRLENQTEETDI